MIVVHDGPGFYTSRVLGPYVAEAAHLLAEGVPIEAIDRALVEFGFPVGPIKLLDEVGIDVAAKAAKVMHQELGERMRPPDAMARLVEAGRLGRKSNKGFYLYAEEHKRGSRKHGKGERPVDPTVYELLGVSPDKELAAEQIALRCTLQMVNEAAHCYGEGILRSARDGDVGAVFGLGFPPFLGGPFRWADTRGARWVLEQLERFAEQLGPRFAPAPVLRELAERTSGFYAPAAPPPGRWRRETRGGAPAPEPAAGASRSG
ncbi:MAG: hypothetical protein KatS3mg102_2862 [Planctomycetota bacterium]|nr:MAG: hypothetical protein KatS3mg102_2862 [Planctomycetota bacterium]